MQTYRLSNPLQHGADLIPLQAALHKAKLYYGPQDGIFGQGTAVACKRAKYRLGYPISAVVPTGGQQLLDFLQGKEALPATYILRRHKRGYGLTAAARQRAAIKEHCTWGVNNERSIHYSMGSNRDDNLNLPPHHLPLYTDCSGFVTLLYKWAGAPDPNGLGYRALGYTGTLLDHGTTIPLHDIEIGDLVIWGRYPGHHVAAAYQVDDRDNPLLCSHGREAGPVLVRHRTETAAQNRPYVVKRYIRD
jgi:hypothetical protein